MTHKEKAMKIFYRAEIGGLDMIDARRGLTFIT